jgi:hypothetical protein
METVNGLPAGELVTAVALTSIDAASQPDDVPLTETAFDVHDVTPPLVSWPAASSVASTTVERLTHPAGGFCKFVLVLL